MNKSTFKIIDFKSIYGWSTMESKVVKTAKEALQIAGELSKISWHHRVEVWQGNRRLLLAVH